MTPLEEDIKILEAGLTAYSDEYKEQADIWKILESKAQVSITVAGVFLAATFAFVQQAGLVCSAKVFVVVTLLALLVALITALRVLQISELLMPVDRAKTLIYELSEESEEVLKGIERINEGKRKNLSWSYGLIVAAATAATAAAVIQLIANRP
jgi:hypothetical protein